jgi:hypothetical protein
MDDKSKVDAVKVIVWLRRIAASRDAAHIYKNERDALAQDLGIPVVELDRQFRKFQRTAAAEVHIWCLRSWARAFADHTFERINGRWAIVKMA